MLLSIQQKFILDTLRKLGCVRQRQLHALVRGRFRELDISEARTEVMLRQLRMGVGDIRLDGGLVYLSGVEPNAVRLEAIDVMLELAEGAPEDFTVKLKRPRLLRFSLGGSSLRLFTVALLTHAADIRLMERDKLERIVWISPSGVVPEGLALPPKAFFAARQEDGLHRFYGSKEP